METGKKSKNNFLMLAIGALGIVFGDIGTSPLYTLKECFSPAYGLELTQQNIIGILSMIFWSLFMVVIVKYTIFIMKADNKGEGGIMSLFSLIVPSLKAGKTIILLTSIGIVGTSLLLSEGMITPAITVLSAVEGLETATPFFKPFIVPLSVIILLILFFQQKHGTERIGKIFGPIMVLWFSVIGILGITYIVKVPMVLTAINPLNAMQFFIRNGAMSFFILAAVVLAITGTEALYADMGHFGKKPIRMAFYFLVMPALVLNYFGQGAAVIKYGVKAIENPFYFICPSWLIYPMIILATFAAIIASQALISGSFSIVQQGMQLGYMPKLKIIHTSKDIHGQIYIPFINYFIMICSILLTVSFGSSSNLAAAYGMSVTGTMLCSTILYFTVMNGIWKWKLSFSIPLLTLFLIMDLSFFSANVSKFTKGGWIPFAVAILFYLIMVTWKDGTQAVYEYVMKENIPIENVISDLEAGFIDVKRVSGNAVFMLGRKNNLSVLLHHIKHNKSLHKKIFLMIVKFERVPFIEGSERVTIDDLGAGFYEVNVRYGYMEVPDINEIFEILGENGHTLNANQTSFYLGRINIGIEKTGKMAFWRKKLFVFLHKNSESAVEYFRLNPGSVIELGRKIMI